VQREIVIPGTLIINMFVDSTNEKLLLAVQNGNE